jgi:hypothetical protein
MDRPVIHEQFKMGTFKVLIIDSSSFRNYFVIALEDSAGSKSYLISKRKPTEQEIRATFKSYEPLQVGRSYGLQLEAIDTIPEFETYFRKPNVTIAADEHDILWTTDSSLVKSSRAYLKELYTSPNIYDRFLVTH